MDQLPEKQYEKLVLEKEGRPVAEPRMAGGLVGAAVEPEGAKKDDLLAIAHLKGLILSIDWEISNTVLGDFTRELNRLKGVWANRKIYLVYVQAMEKLVRYVYVERGDAHPGAIKLLLHLYDNLEQLVVETDWSEEKKRALLQEDVRRFLVLREQIEYGIVENGFQDEGEDKVSPVAEEASSGIAFTPTPSTASSPLSPPAPVADMVDEADIADPADVQAEEFWEEDETLPSQQPFVAKEIALQGVEIDTGADDGDDGDELPLQNGELAPALSDLTLENSQVEVDSDIEMTVSDFFGEDEAAKEIPAGLSLVSEEGEIEDILAEKEDEKETALENDFMLEESFSELSPIARDLEDVVEEDVDEVVRSFTEESRYSAPSPYLY